LINDLFIPKYRYKFVNTERKIETKKYISNTTMNKIVRFFSNMKNLGAQNPLACRNYEKARKLMLLRIKRNLVSNEISSTNKMNISFQEQQPNAIKKTRARAFNCIIKDFYVNNVLNNPNKKSKAESVNLIKLFLTLADQSIFDDYNQNKLSQIPKTFKEQTKN